MLDHEPIFGKKLLKTLSTGMYDNPLFLFREYVQNSADAIDAAVRGGILSENEGQIEITIDAEKRLITFEDNGTGIASDSVKRMLANVGDSTKDPKFNKGFIGIGRLGGLGYCQKVRFETSAQGEAVKSFLEWDAQKLQGILLDKKDHTDAGRVIKHITNTWDEKHDANDHFFKVSLVDVNEPSEDLLNVDDIRQYLSMVAPVPFDYERFPFLEEIEKFLVEENLPKLHEYRLNLNGDEVRKGYENPFPIGEGRTIEILDVQCRTIRICEKSICWYWYCVSNFEGVLPAKCWQRGLRLRKSNIQIGESDCLTNHPRSNQQKLWKEDRGNNYFIGEVHALDEDLIPNARRDYFEQDKACQQFEVALKNEFLNLHQLYHDASAIRSASQSIQAAAKEKKEFETKEKKGAFYDKNERDKAAEKVSVATEKAKAAQRTVEKIREKISEVKEEESFSPISHVYKSYFPTSTTPTITPLTLDKHPKNGFAKDGIKKPIKDVLEIVFDVLCKRLPREEAETLKAEIIKRFTR